MADVVTILKPLGELLWSLRLPLALYIGGLLVLNLLIELIRSLVHQVKSSRKRARFERSDLAAVDKMGGREFEEYLAFLFQRAGFVVQLTPPTGDFGVDLLLEHPTSGERIAIQAKRWNEPVGIRAVQEVHMGRTYYQSTRAIVVTNSEFTPAAIEAARACSVTLIDRPQLNQIIEQMLPEVHRKSA